jgi:hypothetical protein
MEFRGFRSVSEYEKECVRLGYSARRIPFHGPEGACFILLTAVPGHPTGTSIQEWDLFTADESKLILDGVVSGGLFFKAYADEHGPGFIQNGVDVNFLGKLYSHGYYPDNFEDVRAIAQGEPVGLDHPIYKLYPDKKKERERCERIYPQNVPAEPTVSPSPSPVPDPTALDISADGQLCFLF